MENNTSKWTRLSTLFLSGLLGVAVIGYFVGLADGVPQPDGMQDQPLAAMGQMHPHGDAKLIEAVSYADIPQTAMGPTAGWSAAGQRLPEPDYDLFAEITPSPEEKERSSEVRASRRAYNGAPPIVPHAVEGTSDAACYACHSQGMQLGGLKASVMSHSFLANCTQCHAPPPPQPFADVEPVVATTFVGLAAPRAGERAYPGAPPTIPHSQWMRDNCLACHGGPNGWMGMESTHPWRSQCTQCHAPSAGLDQAVAVQHIPWLPALPIKESASQDLPNQDLGE